MCTTYYKTGSSEIIACTVTDRAALALFTVHYHVRVRICMRRCMGLNERSEISPGRPLSPHSVRTARCRLPPSPLSACRLHLCHPCLLDGKAWRPTSGRSDEGSHPHRRKARNSQTPCSQGLCSDAPACSSGRGGEAARGNRRGLHT